MNAINQSSRLTRAADGYIGGICAGLGRHFNISPTLLRIIWIAAMLFAGTGLLLYLALWWIVPREDEIPAESSIWCRNKNGERVPPLRRTANDRKLLGVVGGLARRWDWDPSILRLAVLSLATLSLGLVGILYLIAAIVMPGPDVPVRSHVYPIDF